MVAIRQLRGRIAAVPAVRDWPVRQLPGWVIGWISAVVAADAVLLGWYASRLAVSAHDLAIFAAMLVCSIATLEMTRRVGENHGVVKDVHAAWELPIALLLPLAYAPVLPAIRFAVTQRRIMRVPVHRRVFSASAIGLSYLAAGFTFRALGHLTAGAAAHPASHALAWLGLGAAAALVQWLVNQVLVLPPIKGANPEVRLRDTFARETMLNDLTELSVAVLVAFSTAISIFTVAFAFPITSLLQRSLRHAQLLKDARSDSKTGLLNAATWEVEAAAEVARAVRTRTSLAIVMLDIDKFKGVNDTYGHLLGDQVIKEIAHTLDSTLRDYDLAGRFGGEEFTVLLPQTRAVDAFRIAERVRSHIARLSFIAPGAAGGERVGITVSIGVAGMDAGTRRELPELLAAADAALYRAKSAGRDQVQMISTTRGLSAISGGEAGDGGDQDFPIAFRRPRHLTAAR